MTPKRTSIKLTDGWSFKQTDDADPNAWLPVKRIPSTVHQDLIDNNRLDDPFIGCNELHAQWVGLQSWTYRTTLRIPPFPPGSTIVLAFDGLDTLATVRLDGTTILESDNMFIPHRVDITKLITPGSEHDLQVDLDSALLRASEIRAQHPQYKWLDFDGPTSRPAVRKAQYHWGWDWGPVLMCAGIWRPVLMEVYAARIADVRADVEIAADFGSARVRVTAECESGVGGLSGEVSLRMVGGKEIETATGSVGVGGRLSALFVIPRPSLWMPAGYGSQALYKVDVKLLDSRGEELDSDSRRFGIRKVELVQEPDEHGKSFYFRINGVDVFCGGNNWIPGDSILTNISPERYRAWIELMVESNQVMTRVWGGGIYEHSAFYSACDELGILVWQDFMFACAIYPTYPSILTSIKSEAHAQVLRLRHHPSIILYAGNNEDYQVAESKNLHYDFADKNEENWLRSPFPARYIYESLLPSVIHALSPSTPYHPGSPWGDGLETTDPTVGDKHAWNVWHAPQAPYQKFPSLGGRFNSEFGMQGHPHLSTLVKLGTGAKDAYPQSRLLDFRNKNDQHERRLAGYVAENVRVEKDLASHVHLTQLIQSETHRCAYSGWRKQWGQGRRCGGALVWQMNDCWPVISWAVCDYYLLPKPAYYAIKRALAPLAVGVQREHWEWTGPGLRYETMQRWELWVASSSLVAEEVEVEVRFICVETGGEVKDPILMKRVGIGANATTDVVEGMIDHSVDSPHVILARVWVAGKLVARDMDWPQPLKYLSFPARNVRVQVQDGNKLRVRTERPVKCLVFAEREGCRLSDNGIDVAPGDEQVITVSGEWNGTVPEYLYLGHLEQGEGNELWRPLK